MKQAELRFKSFIHGLALVCLATAVGGSIPSVSAGKNTKEETKLDLMPSSSPQTPGSKAGGKSRPTLKLDDPFWGFGTELKQVNDAQIVVLNRLIQNTEPNSPEMPDLLFRKAELYAEATLYYDFNARQLDQRIADATDPTTKKQLVADQAALEKKRDAWQKDAVVLYTTVVKYPAYTRVPEALFSLIRFLLEDPNQKETAIEYARELAAKYPAFKYIGSIYLTLGNYLFDKGDLDTADKFYDKVIDSKQPALVEYAYYKKAWILFNKGEFLAAFNGFTDIISRVTDPNRLGVSEAEKKANGPLLKESRKDMVRTYAQLTPEKRTLKPWALCKRYGGDKDAVSLMELLGELWSDQGKYDDGSGVYAELMAQFPTSDKQCLWQSQVVHNNLAAGGSRPTPDVLLALKRLGQANQTLQKAAATQQAAAACRESTATFLRELAIAWHREAQKTTERGTYEAAEVAYAEYLALVPPGSASRDELAFWHAELKFKLGSLDNKPDSPHFCEAARQYALFVKQNPKSPRAKEAAFSTVVSWKNCLDIDQEQSTAEAQAVASAKSGKGKTAATTPKMPENWMAFIDSIKVYLEYDPSDENVRYRLGNTYYRWDMLPEAIPWFEKVALQTKADGRPSQVQIYAANLLLDSLNLQLKKASPAEQPAILDKMGRYITTFLGNNFLMKDETLAADLKRLQGDLTRLKIEAMEAGGDFTGAAYAYLDLAEKNPSAQVLHNAAVNFSRAGILASAAVAYDRLIADFPGDPLAKLALFRLAQVYQSLADYPKAAEHYERFATDFPGELGKKESKEDQNKIDAAEALAIATLFRMGLGDAQAAERDANLYIRNYGRKTGYVERTAAVFFGLWPLYEKTGTFSKKLESHFAQYMKLFAKSGGADRMLVALVKRAQNRWSGSCSVPGIHGVCMRIERVRASQLTARNEKRRGAGRSQCGPETKSKVTLLRRNPREVQQVNVLLRAALLLYKDGKLLDDIQDRDTASKDARRAVAKYHAAQAKMLLADKAYEDLIAIKVPSNLVFYGPKKAASIARFQRWVADRSKKLASVKQLYDSVAAIGNAHWTIAAAARVAQAYNDTASNLYTTPIPAAPQVPRGLSKEEWTNSFQDAFCEQMEKQASPFEQDAEKLYAGCLESSTKLNWANSWSQLCGDELYQMRPTQYPLATEARMRAGAKQILAGQIQPILQQQPQSPVPTPPATAPREGGK